ncbi:MAG: YdcF family protein [Betaproteobacteria bacterium]
MLDHLSWIKAVLKVLVLPPTSLLLAALGGLAVSGRFPRFGRVLATIAVLALLGLSLPVVSISLVALLQPPAPFTADVAKGAQAVVILGGGARRYAADYGGDTLAPLTLERVRYGARVARITGLPVLVSGGAPQGGTAEAALMRDVLELEFGVPVRWSETNSLNTRQNALYASVLLHRALVSRIVLVTHAFDMQRARAEFAAQGIDVVPAATGLSTRHAIEWRDWIPGMSALHESYYAIYEIIANVVRHVPSLRRLS